jgi:hypothetical protein
MTALYQMFVEFFVVLAIIEFLSMWSFLFGDGYKTFMIRFNNHEFEISYL